MSGKPFVLAVASGKGGTGKSSVAASLLVTVDGLLGVDLDVEEPNLALLTGCEPVESSLVTLPVPVIDESLCTRCGTCVKECRFAALNMFGDNPPMVNDLCHGCGVCSMVCPVNAITETERPIGEIRKCLGDRDILEGRLTPGMPNPVPVIEAAMDAALARETNIVADCPPGTSCPMVAGVHRADAVVLVTEPTPFGIADLELALEVLSNLGKKGMVVINRSDLGGGDVHSMAKRFGMPVVAELPFSRHVAEAYADGRPPATADPDWRNAMKEIWSTLERNFSL